MRISVIIPCYNEQTTVARLLQRVRAAGIEDMEVIVIDDGSTDGSRALLSGPLRGYIDRLIVHPRNYGKGAAIRGAVAVAGGEIILIQDADLEYHPKHYLALLDPIVKGRADVVYGSRFSRGVQKGEWHYRLFNRISTALVRRLSGLPVTDVQTGYKVLRTSVVKAMALRESRFGIDIEITMKIANREGVRFSEVAIDYLPRRRKDGKKPRMRDAFVALHAIIAYWVRNRKAVS